MGSWIAFCAVLTLATLVFGQDKKFSVPEAKIEALKGGGFRAYVPHVPGITFFAIHINIDSDIEIQDPGRIFGETKQRTGDYWVISFPNEKLQAGNVISYWIFITFNHLGYRRDGLTVTIRDLLDQYPVLHVECVRASTIVNGRDSCVGDVLIDDTFDGQGIAESRWRIENKILTYNLPNYEFNSLENRDETRYVKDGVLYLKPVIRQNELDVRGILDLRQGCTSTIQTFCYHRSATSFILPPVKSAKVVSKTSFKYGKVEIRAKLPEGEWLFPIVELEPKGKENSENATKIWIAYSRGNDHLVGRSRDDIGSRVLFAGPVLNPAEPFRSQRLVSRSSGSPHYSDFHVYGLEWRPGRMSFTIDSVQFGSVPTSPADLIDTRGLNSADNGALLEQEHVLSLGVSVGGINDFPDGYTSGIHPKPWLNTDYRNLVRKFFDARGAWGNTWSDERPALQVDYVKVTAV